MPIVWALVIIISAVASFSVMESLHDRQEAGSQPIVRQTAPARQKAKEVVQPRQTPDRANKAPAISVKRKSPVSEVNSEIGLEIAGHDPDGEIVVWQLQCGRGGSVAERRTASELMECRCSATVPMDLTIYVRAMDDDGAVTEVSTTVRIVKQISTMSDAEAISTLAYISQQNDSSETDRVVATIMLAIIAAAAVLTELLK